MLKKSKQRARRTAREKTRARQTVWRQARQIALLVCVIGLVLIALFVPLVHKKQKDEATLEVQRETQEENKKKQAAEQAAKEEAEKKRPVRVTITATGDCTFAPTQTHGYAGSFHQYYDDYGETYFFDGVKDIVQKDDFTLVNLECALTNASNWAEKEFVLVGKPTYANILSAGSVEGCSLANNHTLDSGANGLADTKEAVKAAGVTYAYYDEVGTYTTREGITIGYVSSSLLSEGADREKYLEDGIRSLREEGVDLVIACCHWGVERTYYPTAYQQKMAHQCIDWGADLVIGNHPHVIQGMEIYQNKVICYSLGNFCFGGNADPVDKDTFMYQQTFTFVEGKLQDDLEAKIIPCSVSSVSTHNDYQPTLADGEKKARILENMRTYSKDYDSLEIEDDGSIRQLIQR